MLTVTMQLHRIYEGTLNGIGLGLLITYMLIFIFLIPLWKYAKFIKAFFNIKVEAIDDDEESRIYTLNNYGKIKITTTWKYFRIYPAFIVSFLLAATTMIFITGCVMAVQYYRSGDLCPDHHRDCITMPKSFIAFSPVDQFVCNPGETIKQSNATSSRLVVCYGFVLKEQTMLNVLKRLGICAAFFVILSVMFNVLNRIVYFKYGIIFNIILVAGTWVTLILAVVFSIRLDYVLYYLLIMTFDIGILMIGSRYLIM